MLRYGSRGLVIITKVPSHFFDRSAKLEAKGTLSLRSNTGPQFKNVDVQLLLPYSSRRPVAQRSLESADESKDLVFCACDTNNNCTGQIPPVITSADPVARICMTAKPSNAVLDITYSAVLYSNDLAAPELEIEYDEVDKNKAIGTVDLTPDFFEENELGQLSLFVKGNIKDVGFTKGQVAFALDFQLQAAPEVPTFSPTGLPQLGAIACICDPESMCLSSYISAGFGDIEICVL